MRSRRRQPGRRHSGPRSSESQPARSAAEWGQRVRSKASEISMISLSRLLHGPSGAGDGLGVGTPQGSPTGGMRRAGTGLRGWRSAVRPREIELSVSEEVRVRLRGGWHVRCQASRASPATDSERSSDRPDFGDALRELGATQTIIHPGRPQTNGMVERVQRTILEECWRPAFARSLVPKLRRALDETSSATSPTTTRNGPTRADTRRAGHPGRRSAERGR